MRKRMRARSPRTAGWRTWTVAAISAAALVVPGVPVSAASAETVWLCKPGQKPDPCTPGLSTTVYTPALKEVGVQHPKAVAHPIFPSRPFDPKSVLAQGIALLGLTQPQPPTVWTTQPGSYRAQCSSANNANVLEISAVRRRQDAEPESDPRVGPAFSTPTSRSATWSRSSRAYRFPCAILRRSIAFS